MPRDTAGGSKNAPTLKDKPMRPHVAPRSVDIDRILANPRNLREVDNEFTTEEDREETAALAHSLTETDGVLQALVVCTRDAFLKEFPEEETALGEGDYVVFAGNRRWEATHLAIQNLTEQGEIEMATKLRKVRIDVRDDLVPKMDVVMLEENMKRKALNVFQEGEGYRRLEAKGMSHGAIAKTVGKGKSTVTKRIALLALNSEAKQAVLDKKPGVDTAYNLLVALGESHRDRLLDAYALMKSDRDLTAVDAVNMLLAGSGRTDESPDGASETSVVETSDTKDPVLPEPVEPTEPPDSSAPTDAKKPSPSKPAVPAARTGPEEPVLPEPGKSSGDDKKGSEGDGRAEASAARNVHCAVLVKQAEKLNQDPQTLRIASSVLVQATPAALKRAHGWMKQAEAADAQAFDAFSYRNAILARNDGQLIAHLAYAVALADDELRASNRTRNWDYRDHAHLQHLIDGGYEPTDWDRRHLPTAAH